VGRAPSTISRELRRNAPGSGAYRPFEGHRRATGRRARHHRRRVETNRELRQLVTELLAQRWSPRVWRSLVSTAWHKAAIVASYARCRPPNRGASPGQQPAATRMSPELSSTTRNVPSARMARPWTSLMPVTKVLTIPDDRMTALIVPPPMSAT
jgi:hypothetical protein